MIYNLEEKQTQKWQVVKLADRKLKRVTLTISKDYKLREMETIKEDTTETSRDLKKKKKTWKEKFPAWDW